MIINTIPRPADDGFTLDFIRGERHGAGNGLFGAEHLWYGRDHGGVRTGWRGLWSILHRRRQQLGVGHKTIYFSDLFYFLNPPERGIV